MEICCELEAYDQAESITWKHSRSPVKSQFKMTKPRKVMATVFSDMHKTI
jgi:hypothetical protein